jgi:hypothetical protein
MSHPAARWPPRGFVQVGKGVSAGVGSGSKATAPLHVTYPRLVRYPRIITLVSRPVPLTLGTRIGSYEITAQIGAGGMDI